MAPGLTEAQQDMVVQGLRGSTLAELLRASVHDSDLSALSAIERNGCMDMAHLTCEHVHSQCDWSRQSVLDASLTPMLDALGQVFSFDREAPMRSRAARGEKREFPEMKEPLAGFITRHIERNFLDVQRSLGQGLLPQPGATAPGLWVRMHLCALGALAVAVNQHDLVGRIKKLDPEALFCRLHSNLVERFMGVHAASPWGIAVLINRPDVIIGQFDPKDITRPLAIDTHYDSEHDVNTLELLTMDGEKCPQANELTLWLIRSLAQWVEDPHRKTHAWETDCDSCDSVGKNKIHPSATWVREICEKDGQWAPIAMDVFMGAPEFFQTNLKECVEVLANTGNFGLLEKVLKTCVDWSTLDRELQLASSNAAGLKFIPFNHPVGIVTDALSGVSGRGFQKGMSGGGFQNDSAALDAALLLTLQVMDEKGALGPMLTNGVSLNDESLCFSHEIAGKSLVRSLGFLLQSGLDFDLKNKAGVGLMTFCEQNHSDGQALPVLRACAAARSVDELLERHRQLANSARALGN